MRVLHALALAGSMLLLACQPGPLPTVTIIDNDRIIRLQTDERLPSAVLGKAGITLAPGDRILVNGVSTAPNATIPGFPATLQIRRAVPVMLQASQGERSLESSAWTVAEALQEASIWLREGERAQPALHTPLAAGMKITVIPLQELSLTEGGKVIQIKSSAPTVGEALAQAGLPLLGLDYSLPDEKEPLPTDGQIRIVRVSESLLLAQKLLPYESELQASADVPLDQTQVLQPGENGLAVQRIRIRYEDGKEISRVAEDEVEVRPPSKRILAYGTKIEVKNATVDGVNIQYWRALQMYATSYSPCRSGTDKCYTGTSSGKSLRKGMVGLRYSWYLSMQGQQLYIPGYGFASVEDVCGGCTGKPWIDLGYSDADFETWHSWVTVYFLTPVPPNVIYVLQ